MGIRHKSRGRAPNNQIHAAKRDYALSVIKEQYPDFGPALVAEMLAEHHGFKVSRETVRKWMVEDGLWLSRKQRRQIHQPRLRRECFGELIQIDGSDHLVRGSRAARRARRWLPRKRDITAVSDHELKMICDRLNSTPRQCLGWKTPAEVFREKMMEEMGHHPYPKKE